MGISGVAPVVSLYFSAAPVIDQVGPDNAAGGIVGDQVILTGGTSPTTWAIRPVRARSESPTKVYDLTRGSSLQGSSSAARGLSNTTLRIGSGTTCLAGEQDVSAAAKYSKYLTDDEIAKEADVRCRRMAHLGISV